MYTSYNIRSQFKLRINSVIASALERRFPPSQGYGTIFPKAKHGDKANTGMIKAFARSYAEAVLFSPVVGLMPWTKVPDAFLKDRAAVSSGTLDHYDSNLTSAVGQLFGAPIDPKVMAERRPKSESIVATNLVQPFHSTTIRLADIPEIGVSRRTTRRWPRMAF